MDISSLAIPYTPDEVIRKHADEFRKLFWDDKIPVNVEVIAERVGIDLFSIPNLRFLTRFEACISNDKKTIYYDPISNGFRLRFSVAHELGHYKLHSTELSLMNPKSYEDWHRIIEEVPEVTFGRFEYQADEFAGRLLVPIEQLRTCFVELKNILDEMKKYIGGNFYATYEYIARDLSKYFEVSEIVMLKRLRKEELNPYDFI